MIIKQDRKVDSGRYIPEVLYKYMTLDRFRGSKNQYLAGEAWFADFEHENDPFEGIPKESCLMVFLSRETAYNS